MSIPFCALTLLPANPAQDYLSRQRAYAQWVSHAGISFDTYLSRDNIIRSFPHASGGRQRTWVLVNRDDLEGEFLCLCRTSEREALISHSSDLPGSNTRRAKAYTITTVLTHPSHRNKGYASHMLRLLHWVLAPSALEHFPSEWGEPPSVRLGDAAFSVLYSDIGDTFYGKCGPWPQTRGGMTDEEQGWTTREEWNKAVRFDVDVLGKALSSSSSEPSTTPTTYLTPESAEEIWQWDARSMQLKFGISGSATATTQSQEPTAERTKICILPTNSIPAYPNRRAGISYSSLSLSSPPSLSTNEAGATPSKKSEIKSRDDKENETVIHRLRQFWGLSLSELPPESGGRTETPDLTYCTWTLDPLPAGPIKASDLILALTRLRVGDGDEERFERVMRGVWTFVSVGGGSGGGGVNGDEDRGKEGIVPRVSCIEIWSLPRSLLPIARRLGGVETVRKNHLGCVKVYAGILGAGAPDERGVGEGKGQQQHEEVEWIHNELYAWS